MKLVLQIIALYVFALILITSNVFADNRSQGQTNLFETQLLQHLKTQKHKPLSVLQTQELLRIITVYKIDFNQLFMLKMNLTRILQTNNFDLNQQQLAEKLMAQILDTKKNMNEKEFNDHLYCRFAISNEPWKEVGQLEQTENAIYAVCFENKEKDPLIKSGYLK